MTQSRRGQYTAWIKAWHNMLMSGKRKPKRLMHRYPFTLVQVVRYDQEGTCKRPMWLLAMESNASN